MHAEYLELSRALLHWSRRQPSEIAIKAELLAFGLELLVDQPDHIPLRQLIKMNAADLVTFAQHAERSLVLPPRQSSLSDAGASPGPDANISRDIFGNSEPAGAGPHRPGTKAPISNY
jgi:hypothetical protein